MDTPDFKKNDAQRIEARNQREREQYQIDAAYVEARTASMWRAAWTEIERRLRHGD